MDYQSKSDIVAASLREMIITGQLQPGEQLKQRQIAADFKISPTPVREALRRLEAEGLVSYDIHRGATVIGGALGPMEENYRVRATLESYAARLAATRISDRELAELQEIHDRLASVVKKDPDDIAVQFANLNREFHFFIYTASRSPLLLALLRLLWQSFAISPTTVLSRTQSVARHQDIVDALRAHDGERAQEITGRHIMEAGGYLRDGDDQPVDGMISVIGGTSSS